MHALARRTQRLLPGQAVARLEPLRAQRVEHGVGDGGFVFDEEDGGHGAGGWGLGAGGWGLGIGGARGVQPVIWSVTRNQCPGERFPIALEMATRVEAWRSPWTASLRSTVLTFPRQPDDTPGSPNIGRA